jgi:uncharacterized protein (DUF1778 family)
MTKKKQIQLLLTEEEKALIERAAAFESRPVANWIRVVILRAANETVQLPPLA